MYLNSRSNVVQNVVVAVNGRVIVLAVFFVGAGNRMLLNIKGADGFWFKIDFFLLVFTRPIRGQKMSFYLLNLDLDYLHLCCRKVLNYLGVKQLL